MCSDYTTTASVLVFGPGSEEGQFADLSEPAGWRRQLLSSAGAEVCKQEDKMGAQNQDVGPPFSSTTPDVTSFLWFIQMDLMTAVFPYGSIQGELLTISHIIDFSAAVSVESKGLLWWVDLFFFWRFIKIAALTAFSDLQPIKVWTIMSWQTRTAHLYILSPYKNKAEIV